MATEPLVESDGCVCKDWEETMPKLNGPIVLASIRAGNPNLYTGTPFKFCPWCGATLELLRQILRNSQKRASVQAGKREITSFGQGMLDDVMAEPQDQPE